MISLSKFKEKKFAVYGMGKTGCSTALALSNSKIKADCWDDNKLIRTRLKKKGFIFKKFWTSKKKYDYIVVSPGIDIKKNEYKNFFKKNNNKVIIDLDLFFKSIGNHDIISVTGTNGKSTTCKILEKIFKDAGFSVQLGGNIGIPALSLKKFKRKTIYILEVSSYQLAYSKFFSSKHAAILNISIDHLDRHLNLKNYLNAKSNIFLRQSSNDFVYLNSLSRHSKYFFKILDYKKKKPNVIKIKKNKVNSFIKRMNNVYLKTQNNLENICFAKSIANQYKIKNNLVLKSLDSFKGLSHRQELVFFKKKIKIINDSKATSFSASLQSLRSYNRIYWIVGGLPKLNDKFNIDHLSKKIIKSYVIGKNPMHFVDQIDGKVDFSICVTIKKALKEIISDIKKNNNNNYTILLSPAAASFDQYKNFEERGNDFKNLIKKTHFNFLYV